MDFITTPDVNCPNCNIIHSRFETDELKGDEKTYPFYRVNKFQKTCDCGTAIYFNRTMFIELPFSDYQMEYVLPKIYLIDRRKVYTDAELESIEDFKIEVEEKISDLGHAMTPEIKSYLQFFIDENDDPDDLDPDEFVESALCPLDEDEDDTPEEEPALDIGDQ